MSRVDATAARVLVGAALVALGVGLAASGLAWTVDTYPGLVVSGYRPAAGSLLAFLATLTAATMLFGVRELIWSGRLREAMWGAFSAGLVAVIAAWAATGHAGRPGPAHLIGPAGLLVPVSLGTAAIMALLASSSLYEALRRDPLPPAEVAHAQARLDAVMRPPEELYFVYY